MKEFSSRREFLIDDCRPFMDKIAQLLAIVRNYAARCRRFPDRQYLRRTPVTSLKKRLHASSRSNCWKTMVRCGGWRWWWCRRNGRGVVACLKNECLAIRRSKCTIWYYIRNKVLRSFFTVFLYTDCCAVQNFPPTRQPAHPQQRPEVDLRARGETTRTAFARGKGISCIVRAWFFLREKRWKTPCGNP